jgi:hypothetical protein
MVAAKLATMRQGRPLQNPANLPEISQGQAADMLNVGERSVRDARVVLNHGTPADIAAVERGKLSVSAEIPATVVDLADIVRGEFAENTIRKAFLPTEVDAIRRALAPIVATPVGRPTKENKENFLNNERGQTRDKIAAFAGWSGRSIEKIAAVVEAAEREPEKFAAASRSNTGCSA